ncbi:PAF acetylhydrolase family protein [Aaosphaeria arxii CBS 175.79]|uniref:1-alkyl-2-acetylglycerophosphocholine esterase n=1 Tax=Aaosphaeria arxii CBS 175.79 TaxID=1450172 RepID=A0A6A5XX92_9PLEO|nr:PAF acetylhydrolase family protein [Aaosphaeria arxii CBS 175.79]KAF2017945.1 PAF acetylhydrolase family protein [Aaosphaeria arxii CBS 175.79]
MLNRLSLLAFLGFAAPLISGTVLPIVGSDPSQVAIYQKVLTDQERLDPFAKDGRARSIAVTGFSPLSACRRHKLQPYMPPTTAGFEDEKFAAYGLPNGTFRSLYLDTCTLGETPKSGSLPLVLFSGALATSRTLYNGLLQSVAAKGYLVISIDHPYDADIVELSNGTVVTGVDISDDELEAALKTRTEDIAFVYNQVLQRSLLNEIFPKYRTGRNAPKTAVLGHSFGGAAAASTLKQIASIKGGINLDGTMFGDVLKTGFDRPFMLVGHENKTQATDPSWKAVWANLKGWKKEFEVKRSAHYGFSDLPLIASTLGLQDKLPSEVEQVLGSIEGRRMTKLTVDLVVAFLDMVLKSRSQDRFACIGKEFPEVVEAN